MFKLIFGALLGAAAMYFFDPREGQSRRRQVKDRVQEMQHRGNGASKFEDAYDAAQSSARRAEDSMSRTVDAASEQGRSAAGQTRRSNATIAESTPDQTENTPTQ
jgi:gas vesicle protein